MYVSLLWRMCGVQVVFMAFFTYHWHMYDVPHLSMANVLHIYIIGTFHCCGVWHTRSICGVLTVYLRFFAFIMSLDM